MKKTNKPEKRKASRRHAKHPGGFWDKTDPAVISVRTSSSRLARGLAFLLKFIGLGRHGS